MTSNFDSGKAQKFFEHVDPHETMKSPPNKSFAPVVNDEGIDALKTGYPVHEEKKKEERHMTSSPSSEGQSGKIVPIYADINRSIKKVKNPRFEIQSLALRASPGLP